MAHFEASRLTQNTFILVTTLIAVSGWLVALGGACTLKALNGAWWIVVYEALIVALCIFVILSGTMNQYRLMVLAFLATSIPLLTIQIDYVLQYAKVAPIRDPANAYAAGYIMLAIVQFLWIAAFGSEEASNQGKLGNHSGMTEVQEYSQASPTLVQHVVAEKQLDEPHSPVQESQIITPPTSAVVASSSIPSPQPQLSQQVSEQPVMEYREKVEALHAYRANPEDPSELSFEKGELLEVVDRQGNWWQARKADGTIGIIPSNYFAQT